MTGLWLDACIKVAEKFAEKRKKQYFWEHKKRNNPLNHLLI
jgi:hypothetical protein